LAFTEHEKALKVIHSFIHTVENYNSVINK